MREAGAILLHHAWPRERSFRPVYLGEYMGAEGLFCNHVWACCKYLTAKRTVDERRQGSQTIKTEYQSNRWSRL